MIPAFIPLWGETVVLPGSVDQLSIWTQFFYNYPEEDFLYHFNDRMLFLERVDAPIRPDSWRGYLLELQKRHNQLKKMAKEIPEVKGKWRVSFEVSTKRDQKLLDEAAGLLGLLIEQKGNRWQVSDNTQDQYKYYYFARIEPGTVQARLNSTGRLIFEFNESEVSFPWDFKFLSRISGLTLNRGNLFEMMLRNKRLSFLLAIFYRLSEREIRFLTGLGGEPHTFLRNMFGDSREMMGFFMLSHALRIHDGELLFPGGGKSEPFWSHLAGVSYRESPAVFLRALATKDDGKLNHLFTFSFFLPEEKRRLYFRDYDLRWGMELYELIRLEEREKLDRSIFPRINTYGLLFLPYLLKEGKDDFYFPGGARLWLESFQSVMEGSLSQSDIPKDDFSSLIHFLSEKNRFKPSFDETNPSRFADEENVVAAGSGKVSSLQIFMALYAKFHRHPELITKETLPHLIRSYPNFNVMIDYLERIPVHSPAIVSDALQWAESFARIGRDEGPCLTAISQSLLEIIAQSARCRRESVSYEQILGKLFEIPLRREGYFDQIMDFIEFTLKKTGGKTPLECVTANIPRYSLVFQGTRFLFDFGKQFEEEIGTMIEFEEAEDFHHLRLIHLLIREIEKKIDKTELSMIKRLENMIDDLPYPDMSEKAPLFLRKRVFAYSRGELSAHMERLQFLFRTGGSTAECRSLLLVLKSRYLMPHLQEYLLALSYALNARHQSFKGFLNPNLIRVHEFESGSQRTPWNFCGRGEKRHLSGNHFRGGLSRLGLILASVWKDQLFSGRELYNHEQIQSLMANILDAFPKPGIEPLWEDKPLLVDACLDLKRRAGEEEPVRKALESAGENRLTGFHYRRLQGFLEKRESDSPLFFEELADLGEWIALNVPGVSSPSLDRWRLRKAAMKGDEEDRMSDPWGRIFFFTFGSVQSLERQMFPQELGFFTNSRHTGGELNRELKIKTAYHAWKQGFHPELLGHFMFDFVLKQAPRYFSQNSPRDLYSVNFIFNLLNVNHLRRTVRKLQSEGGVRLK